MQKKDLISIIVPIFNSGVFLEKCIASLINQTYQNIEIVLINDGSTDKSALVCEQYRTIDDRIILYSQDNQGVSVARNKGIELANGEYITFVDSDDELLPNALEILYKDIILYNADISSATKRRVYHQKEILYKNENSSIYIYEDKEVIDLAIEGKSQSACSKLFKYKVIENIRFVEGRKVNEDGFFMFQCYLGNPRVVHRDVVIYNYNVRNNSVSRSEFSDKYLDMLYFLEKKKEIISRDFPEYSDKIKNMEMRTHLLFLQILCKTKDAKYKEYEESSIYKVKNLYSLIDKKTQSKHERRVALIINLGLYKVYRVLLRILKKV